MFVAQAGAYKGALSGAEMKLRVVPALCMQGPVSHLQHQEKKIERKRVCQEVQGTSFSIYKGPWLLSYWSVSSGAQKPWVPEGPAAKFWSFGTVCFGTTLGLSVVACVPVQIRSDWASAATSDENAGE